MKNSGTEHLSVFIKILVSLVLSTIVPIVLINIFVILAKRFTNIKLNPITGIYMITIPLVIAFVLSLIMYHRYLHVSKSIVIVNRFLAKENIKIIMKEMKWKTMSEDDNVFTFRYPFLKEFRSFKTTVRFRDTEVIIDGPKEYVDKIIEEIQTQEI